MIGLPAFHRIKLLHRSDPDTVRAAVQSISEAEGWKPLRRLMLISVEERDDDDPYTFDLKTISSSPLTFGERIYIKIGETEVYVLSECLNPAQIIDFGRNRRIVEHILDQLVEHGIPLDR